MNAKRKFLIVDEQEANTLFFTVVLRELGQSEVITATDGPSALERVKKDPVHFVIAAWEMQRMSGTVFVQRLRTQTRRPYIPHLLYSKRMTEQDLQLTRELGIGNVLGLPLDRERARAALAAMIERETSLSPAEQKMRKIEGFIEAGKPAEALRLCDNPVRSDPGLAIRVQTALGRIAYLQGRHAEAEKHLRAALTGNPDSMEAGNTLANVLSKLGRHDEAIAMLKAKSAASPQNISTLLNLGGTYVEADRHQEAKEVYAAVSILDEDSPALKEEKGKLAFKEGNLPLATQLLAETTNGDNLARHFNNLAIGLTHAGRHGEAVATYMNAVKLLADKAKLHALNYNLGLAYMRQGDLEKAFAALARSYLDNPEFEKAYAALARVAQELRATGKVPDQALVRSVKTMREKHPPAAAKDGGESNAA